MNELEKMLADATRHFSLPFHGDEGCMKIWDANTRLVADVRSWGYLTGKGTGALGLSDEDALKAQRDLMHAIVAAVNALPELLALKQFVQANFYTKPDGGIYPMWHDWADYSEKVEPEISAFVRAALNQETKP